MAKRVRIQEKKNLSADMGILTAFVIREPYLENIIAFFLRLYLFVRHPLSIKIDLPCNGGDFVMVRDGFRLSNMPDFIVIVFRDGI